MSVLIWLVLGGVVTVGLVVGIVILARSLSKGPPLAIVTMTQAGPFSLALPPGVVGPVAVWVRHAVAFPHVAVVGSRSDHTFCLVLDLTIDGQQRFTLGHGGRQPAGLLEFEGLVQYTTSFTSGGPQAPSQYSASVMVKRLPAAPSLIQGTINGGNGTTLLNAVISVEKA